VSTVHMAHPRPRTRTRADHAFVALLRAVMAEGWRPDEAARELLETVRQDRRLLRLVRARISRAMLERPTGITERATLTLELALSTAVVENPSGASLPRQGGTAHV
jgi:hypothetical protein